jgi:hypothetical protein
MATTATSARPEIELRGTSGVSKRGLGPTGIRAGADSSCWSSLSAITFLDHGFQS